MNLSEHRENGLPHICVNRSIFEHKDVDVETGISIGVGSRWYPCQTSLSFRCSEVQQGIK